MYILGLNAYHGDASACLIKDGKIIAAAEEERFRRLKHWAGFPSQAVRYCLEEAGVGICDIEHFAINSDPRENVVKRVGFALKNRPSLASIMGRIKNRRKRASVKEELKLAFPGEDISGEVHRIEHHLSHLASCFLVSPFKQAVAVSVDGFGDFSSAAVGVGTGTQLTVDQRVFFPHSLGTFYQAMTQFIGFPHYGDEYKVMGLGPYGKPTFMEQMRQIVHLKEDGTFALNLDYFRHHNENIDYEWENCTPHVGTLFSDELATLMGPGRDKDAPLEQRHHDIARSVQDMYEEAFFNMLNRAYERYNLPDVTLAGGCAMNSVANGKICRETKFKRVYVQSAAGDAGGAIGAAIYTWHQLDEGKLAPRTEKSSALSGDVVEDRFIMDHASWGPHFDNDQIDKLLSDNKARLAEQGCSIERIDNDDALCLKTAEAIADGLVVGWFQGRMEWGPRALGNRSIVCDPRRADMKDILNLKIKRRESFRPFAPSILREKVSEWFEEDDDVPFMMKVFQIEKDKRDKIPAVTHVNGSGRLQTVYKATNPRYHLLISKFNDLTNVPIVLNTSFNENEPVVCQPGEAMDCFLRTKMDVLVLENWFVRRNNGQSK